VPPVADLFANSNYTKQRLPYTSSWLLSFHATFLPKGESWENVKITVKNLRLGEI